MRNKFAGFFWKGLLTLLPIYLTFYFLYWLITNIEINLGGVLKVFIGHWYFPGLGLITGIVIILFIGLLTQIYIAQWLVNLIEKLVKKMPIIGDIYSSVQSLTNYFSSSGKVKGKEVVMVEFNGIELLGIITRNDFKKAPKGMVESADIVAVYIPMSYQIGGFTVYLPENKIRKISMEQKSALKWSFMAGIEE